MAWGDYRSGGCHNDTTQWRRQKDDTLTCSYCGSLHPDDFMTIMDSYIQGLEGFAFSTTTKGYKLYGHRPGTSNAGDGGIKFYSDHLPEDRDEFLALLELAVIRQDYNWQIRRKDYGLT